MEQREPDPVGKTETCSAEGEKTGRAREPICKGHVGNDPENGTVVSDCAKLNPVDLSPTSKQIT